MSWILSKGGGSLFISETTRNTVYAAIETFLANNGDTRLPQMEFSMLIKGMGEFFYNAFLEDADNFIVIEAPDKKQADILAEFMRIYNFYQVNCENVLCFAARTPAELNNIVMKLNKTITEHVLEGTFKCMLTEENGNLDYWNVTKDNIELADAPIDF